MKLKSILNETMVSLAKWWEYSPKQVMSFIYWMHHKLPPSNKDLYKKNWNIIKSDLIKKFPPPKNVKEQMAWTSGGGENGVESTFEPEKSHTNKVYEQVSDKDAMTYLKQMIDGAKRSGIKDPNINTLRDLLASKFKMKFRGRFSQDKFINAKEWANQFMATHYNPFKEFGGLEEQRGYLGTDKCECTHPRDSHKFGNSMCRRCDCKQFVNAKSTVDEKVMKNWHCKKCGYTRPALIWSDATRSSYHLSKFDKCPKCGSMEVDVMGEKTTENNTALPIVRKKLREKEIGATEITRCKTCGKITNKNLEVKSGQLCRCNVNKKEGMDDKASGYFMERIAKISSTVKEKNNAGKI